MISPTQHGYGGIPTHVDELVRFLKSRGHQVNTISADNTPIININKLKNPSFMISSFLKCKFKQQDIVHAHNIPSTLAMRYSTGKKILTLHSMFSGPISYLHGSTLGNLSKRYEINALSWADSITAVTKETVDYYANLGYPVKQILNAIDISNLPHGTEQLYDNQIIFAGRLSREKGTRTLVEIIKHLPNDIHLLVAGSGPDEQQIIRAAANKSNIHLLGHISKERLMPLLRGSKIMIQPSLYEGISTSILEAMACQTLVITTRVGGNIELIHDKLNGILVESDDPDTMLSKILQYISDSTTRNNMIKYATAFVKKYNWENTGKLYLKLYESLLNNSLKFDGGGGVETIEKFFNVILRTYDVVYTIYAIQKLNLLKIKYDLNLYV